MLACQPEVNLGLEERWVHTRSVEASPSAQRPHLGHSSLARAALAQPWPLLLPKHVLF